MNNLKRGDKIEVYSQDGSGWVPATIVVPCAYAAPSDGDRGHFCFADPAMAEKQQVRMAPAGVYCTADFKWRRLTDKACEQYVPMVAHPFKICSNCGLLPGNHAPAAVAPPKPPATAGLSFQVVQVEMALRDREAEVAKLKTDLKATQAQLAERMDACRRYEAEANKYKRSMMEPSDKAAFESRLRQAAEARDALDKYAQQERDRANRLGERVLKMDTAIKRALEHLSWCYDPDFARAIAELKKGLELPESVAFSQWYPKETKPNARLADLRAQAAHLSRRKGRPVSLWEARQEERARRRAAAGLPQ